MTSQESPFLPSTEVWPKDQSEFLVKITSVYTNTSQAINLREIASYEQNQQIVTGQKFSDPANTQNKKYTYRQVYYFGSIAPGATLTVAHGIKSVVQFTHMYGTCITAAVDYRPIPYVSTVALNQQISLTADATNFYVTNGAGGPAITSGIVVLEYLLT